MRPSEVARDGGEPEVAVTDGGGEESGTGINNSLISRVVTRGKVSWRETSISLNWFINSRVRRLCSRRATLRRKGTVNVSAGIDSSV